MEVKSGEKRHRLSLANVSARWTPNVSGYRLSQEWHRLSHFQVDSTVYPGDTGVRPETGDRLFFTFSEYTVHSNTTMVP